MQKNYFIIHGTFGDPKDHWFGWLKKEIEKKGFKCITPKFETKEDVNNYESRKRILKKYVDSGDINSNTVFIGHSSGPIVISKFLIEEKIKVRGIISVSGFNNALTPYENYNRINRDFFLSSSELKKIKDYTEFIYCFYSDNDPYLKLVDLEYFADFTNGEKLFIKNAGHFNTEAGYTTFYKLLSIIND